MYDLVINSYLWPCWLLEVFQVFLQVRHKYGSISPVSPPGRQPIRMFRSQKNSTSGALMYKMPYLPFITSLCLMNFARYKLDQGKFLLNITGAYSTTPTAALQVIEGILPLHIKAEQEAVYVRTARLRKTSNYNNINFNPNNYEDGTTSTKFHPAIFQLEDRISLKKQFLPVPGLNIFTDGSKIEDKTGSAFCVMEEDTTKYEWMAQLSPFNTVFQAELLSIK
ncbi:hypothetical protein AVEN_48484-1 [Araneus ventricosus]|uniref:RNase H type-1 domain-containing protein n=1 Tax=Araneus ventricosus TaxID=182803 RepID=A0A4Y2FCV4_ARAVE|nr:hypothetical protein AVEN_48484-1 [Araneus ventricosus]